MPKQKTHSGAKKRFRVTRNGKVMSSQKNRAHLLTTKSSRRCGSSAWAWSASGVRGGTAWDGPSGRASHRADRERRW